ncbi:proteinase-activated receptor 1-like [Rana temporaria]|uniref:proteinase-activated receptor 1-like n=1 Tax=Rana temporaria TaxID=8407 RepID=UPI001AAD36EB|nr:proteinase-activated receptor 1-like [Rana temporaria]
MVQMQQKALKQTCDHITEKLTKEMCDLDGETDDKGNLTSTVISDEYLVHFRSPWLTKFIPLVYTVVFLLSLPLNVTAIMIFLFRIHLKKPSVVFMFNLAVADVLFVILLPFNIVYRFSGNNWVIGEGMCRFVTAAFYCNMYCSILLMTSISVDRFLGVVYPFQSLTWRTVSRAWLVCLLIWMVSIAGTVPLLVNKLTVPIYQMNITTCYDMLNMKDIQRFYFPYFTTYISAFFLLPFIVTTFCYVMTIRSLSSPKSGNPNKKSRAIFLCAVVLFEYIFCFGPTNVIFFIYYLNFDKSFGNSVYFVYILSASVSTISCCLDPVVYYYGFSKSQKLEYKLVCCGKTMVDFIESFTPSRTTGRETSSQTL